MTASKIGELYEAIYDGDCDRIDALVREGLSVDTRVNGDKWNFLHMALVSVSIPPNAEVIRHLISIGVDVNAQDRDEWCPLHFAVRARDPQIVKMLLDAGADVDAVTSEGITPLHQSVLGHPCNLEIVEMLLAAGANPDIDRGGGTTRAFAHAVSSDSSDKVIELLEKYS